MVQGGPKSTGTKTVPPNRPVYFCRKDKAVGNLHIPSEGSFLRSRLKVLERNPTLKNRSREVGSAGASLSTARGCEVHVGQLESSSQEVRHGRLRVRQMPMRGNRGETLQPASWHMTWADILACIPAYILARPPTPRPHARTQARKLTHVHSRVRAHAGAHRRARMRTRKRAGRTRVHPTPTHLPDSPHTRRPAHLPTSQMVIPCKGPFDHVRASPTAGTPRTRACPCKRSGRALADRLFELVTSPGCSDIWVGPPLFWRC